MTKNFAIIGVGGYVAPRHLEAIRETGNKLIAAVDPKDSVGLLDHYDFNVNFFTEIDRFNRYLDKLSHRSETERAHYISICSPSYMHDAHNRLAMRLGANVICEKPLVINPRDLDNLEELEQETGCRVSTILQLRMHPEIIKLRQMLLSAETVQHDVVLTYIAGRGKWYHVSWKGQIEKSGGIATNIGIHMFDLLIWLFGKVEDLRLYHADSKRISGFLEMERARVRWFLSVDDNDLPFSAEPRGKTTYRSIALDGQEFEFSQGFVHLHTRVYEEILSGHGFRISDARPSIELSYRIRKTNISPLDSLAHPLLKNVSRHPVSGYQKFDPVND